MWRFWLVCVSWTGYHGIYPRHNGWRFIHGVASADGEPSQLASAPPRIVWTADATFGDDKYNYFKLLAPEAHASGALLESAAEDTYQQQDVAFGQSRGSHREEPLMMRLDET